MEEVRDVLPIGAVIGMPVLSRATGNKLGSVRDVCVDPVNGLLLGLAITAADGNPAILAYDDIYCFGRDAIMAETDDAARPQNNDPNANLPQAREHLVGTKVISESGKLLGQIANVFVTLQPPPLVVYEIRSSILDKLLGREFFVLASAGHSLSDDAERLLVPEGTAETAATNIADLVNQALMVRTFAPPESAGESVRDDTWVSAPEEETVLRRRDEDETVLRHRRTGESE